MRRIGLGAAAAGVTLAVLAILRDDRRIAWVAIGVLAAAIVLRGLTRWRAAHPADPDDEPPA